MSLIDDKDKKVLFELDRDSRQSIVSIARNTRISPETVRYRLENLLKHGLIQNFLTVIDGGKLGFYYYKIFFRFRNSSESVVQKVIDFLKRQRAVTWIVRVDGPFDLGFTVNVKNPIELSYLIDEIRERFSSFIHRWKYSVNINMEFLNRDYLLNRERKRSRNAQYSARTKPYALDSVDWGIIQSLSKNSRATAMEIARELPIGEDSVSLRIKKLERAEVIVRYTVVPNLAKLHYVNYYVLIFMNSVSPEAESKFVNYCKSSPHLVYLIKALGEWDYELNLEVSSIQDYRNIMMDLTKRFSHIIRDYSGLLVEQIHKYVYP